MRIFKRQAVLATILTKGLSYQANSDSAISSDKWRVVATDVSWYSGSGGKIIQIAELRLFEQASQGGANVAPQGTATASSSWGSGYAPGNALDGNDSSSTSIWCNANDGQYGWLAVTFPSAKTLRSASIVWFPQTGLGYIPKSFNIEYSTDGGFTWKVAASGTVPSSVTSSNLYTTSHTLAIPVPTLGKGYVAGGWSSPTATTLTGIDLIDFTTSAVSQFSASLATEVQGGGSFSGAVAGYVAGGTNNSGAYHTAIEKLTFATGVRSTPSSSFANVHKEGPGGFSDVTTKGYLATGMTNSGKTTSVESLTFASDVITPAAGTLGLASNRVASMQSATKGYIAGGSVSAATSTIESFTFSSAVAATLGATLSSGCSGACGLYSATAGYVAGGNAAGYRAVIEKLVFATEARTISGAALFQARGESPAGTVSATKGYAAGGYTTATLNKVDGLAFETDTSITASSNLSSSRCYASGLSS